MKNMQNQALYTCEFTDLQLRYIFEYSVREGMLCVAQARIQNLEQDREEEVKIYGYIVYEVENYVCNLSQELDIPVVFGKYIEYVEQIRRKILRNFSSN